MKATTMRMHDESDHNAMLKAGAAWRRLKLSGKRNWSDWTMMVGPALVKARTEAMRIAGTNSPTGRGYNTAMSGLLVEYRLDDMDKVTRADMLNIMGELQSVESWRAKQPGRERLNHPTTVWRDYKKSGEHKAVHILDEEEEGKPRSPKGTKVKPSLAEEAAELRQLLAQAEARIEELTQELESARARIKELDPLDGVKLEPLPPEELLKIIKGE